MHKNVVIALIFILLFIPASAIANVINYIAPTAEKPGELRGELPLNRIGAVLLPRGLVSLADGEFNVLAVPRWLFDRNLVLHGAIVRAEVVSQSNLSIVGGLVYFLDGQWLSSLGKENAIDTIDTMNDTRHRGRVLARAGQDFLFRRHDGSTEKIAFADIKSISSPRAFTFNISAPSIQISPSDSSMKLEATGIVLNQTRVQHKLLARNETLLPRSRLPGTEVGISDRALAAFVAFDIASIIAPAIVTPLVLNPRTQQAAINAQIRFVQQSQIHSAQSSMASQTHPTH